MRSSGQHLKDAPAPLLRWVGPSQHRGSRRRARAPAGIISIDIGGSFADKAALSPRESAPGPSGSFSSGSPATARMTLPTVVRTHLGRRNASPIWIGTYGSNPSPSSGESYKLDHRLELS